MKKLFKIVLATAATGLLGYMLALHFREIQRNVSARDSIAYWSAGRLLIQHQDPYDRGSVLQLERQQGYEEDRPLVLRTPPWSLFMVLPLGFINPFFAWLLWMAISFACLFGGMTLCKRMYGGDSAPRGFLSVIAYTFAAVPACLVSGQMGLVLMLGVVLFLLWEGDHPFLAGAALVLPFAKPHLLSLFWVVLLLWVVVRKKRNVVLGFGFAFASAVAIALLFDRNVFQHYR